MKVNQKNTDAKRKFQKCPEKESVYSSMNRSGNFEYVKYTCTTCSEKQQTYSLTKLN